MTSSQLVVTVEFDRDAAPATGRVRTDAADAIPFSGWADLFALLRAIAAHGASEARGGLGST